MKSKYKALAIVEILTIMISCMTQPMLSQLNHLTLGGSRRDVIQGMAGNKNGDAFLSCFVESTDSDFVRKPLGNSDLCVVKVTSDGRVSWKSTVITYGIDSSGYDYQGRNNSGVTYTPDPTVYNYQNRINLSIQRQLAVPSVPRPIPIAATVAGGCVVATSVSSDLQYVKGRVGCGLDIFVSLLDANGRPQWAYVLGGTRDDVPYAVYATPDSGAVIAGYTSSRDGEFARDGKIRVDINMFILKLDSKGKVQWVHTYGGSRSDVITDIKPTSEGGWLASGWSDSNNDIFDDMNKGAEDAFIMKLDSRGAIQWLKTYGSNGPDFASALQPMSDSSWLVAGTTRTRGWLYNFIRGLFTSDDADGDFQGKIKGYYDAFFIKVRNDGEIVWTSTVGGGEADGCSALVISERNDVIATGFFNSNDGDFEGIDSDTAGVYTVCIDEHGKRKWLSTLGGSNEDWPTCAYLWNDELVLGVNSTSDDGVFINRKRGASDIHLFRIPVKR